MVNGGEIGVKALHIRTLRARFVCENHSRVEEKVCDAAK